MKLFPESQKSSFAYWFAHWRSFNLTAMLLGVWKFKYLFHDIEKPFLMWMWKDYPRVREWHRTHARHHWQYKGKKGYDFMAMVIDWECSRFSKADAQMNAWETWLYDCHHHPEYMQYLLHDILPILDRLHLSEVRQKRITIK